MSVANERVFADRSFDMQKRISQSVFPGWSLRPESEREAIERIYADVARVYKFDAGTAHVQQMVQAAFRAGWYRSQAWRARSDGS